MKKKTPILTLDEFEEDYADAMGRSFVCVEWVEESFEIVPKRMRLAVVECTCSETAKSKFPVVSIVEVADDALGRLFLRWKRVENGVECRDDRGVMHVACTDWLRREFGKKHFVEPRLLRVEMEEVGMFRVFVGRLIDIICSQFVTSKFR